jgi:hypothetical protein
LRRRGRARPGENALEDDRAQRSLSVCDCNANGAEARRLEQQDECAASPTGRDEFARERVAAENGSTHRIDKRYRQGGRAAGAHDGEQPVRRHPVEHLDLGARPKHQVVKGPQRGDVEDPDGGRAFAEL